jgi:hypothetical protein
MQDNIDSIEKTILELHRREKAYSEAVAEMVEAETNYRRKRAMIYLNADGTIADRNSQADVECWEEHKRKIGAEATLALTKALLEDARAVLSARQSILSAKSKTNFSMDLHALKQT